MADKSTSVVGDNIKSIRKAMGYSSVFKFATALGLPEKRVTAWEVGDGNPKVEDAILLSKFFEIDLELLVKKRFSEEEAKSIALRLVHNKDSDNLNGIGTYKGVSKTTPMNDLILMSLERLLKLQDQEVDPQMLKAIAQVIQYKRYAEGLERENKLLKETSDRVSEVLERENKTLLKILEDQTEELKEIKKIKNNRK